MKNITTVKIKKRYQMQAEVRSYVLDRIKAKGHNMKFEFENMMGELETMTVPHAELERGKITARGIKSKLIEGQVFDIISYPWENDEDRRLREAGGEQVTFLDKMFE